MSEVEARQEITVAFQYTNTTGKTLMKSRPNNQKDGSFYAANCKTRKDVNICQKETMGSERYWHRQSVLRGDHSNATDKHSQDNNHPVYLN